MALIEQLQLVDFRNYENGEFCFAADRVVLTGPNGSGKTNLLESIFFLSILRSFRSASGREMIRLGARGFELKARIRPREYPEQLRVVQRSGKREIFIDANRIPRSSEFIHEFRAVVFVPEDRNIVAGSSLYRRRFLDMLIATLDREYLHALSSYNRALMQRNRALKQTADLRVVAAFEPELARHAPVIFRKRQEYLIALEQEVSHLLAAQRLTGKFHIRYRSDFPADGEEYQKMLARNRQKEMLRGHTANGPHLDEAELYWNDRLLRYYGSTGQIRMISLLLKMAEFRLICRESDEKVAVLVDDVTGELDQLNRQFFFDTIAVAGQQFFTFTEFPEFDYFKESQEVRLGIPS